MTTLDMSRLYLMEEKINITVHMWLELLQQKIMAQSLMVRKNFFVLLQDGFRHSCWAGGVHAVAHCSLQPAPAVVKFTANQFPQQMTNETTGALRFLRR